MSDATKKTTISAQIGDVIQSLAFATCYEVADDFLLVGGNYKVATKEYDDSTRGVAHYVVEESFYKDESYSGGLFIKARRLNPDGTYNPRGEVIAFWQKADSGCEPAITEVNLIGKMERVVWFVPRGVPNAYMKARLESDGCTF